MIFCVDIMSSWTSRRRKRWHSQQNGFNCFAFSRRTMRGLPEIRMNPSPQSKRRVTLLSKSVDMTCPMVALVSDAAPHNLLRVSAHSKIERFRQSSPPGQVLVVCRAPSIWICGTARSRRRHSASHAPPAHPDSKSLPTDVARTPSSAHCVRSSSSHFSRHWLWARSSTRPVL